MPGWNNVEKLVEGTGEHSTLIGKFWITSFFVVRYLLVISIAKASWGDDQGKFVCNTESPGCKNVCFNEFSPIAPVRFWFFQLLAVSVMSIVFNVYTTHKLALVSKAVRKKRVRKIEVKSLNQVKLKAGETKINEENKADKAKQKIEEPQEEVKDDKVVATKLQNNNPPKLFLGYFCMVFLRLVVEVGFMVGQYHLYTYKFVVPELWECHHWPCPNVVDCFVSRPKEKTIMICSFYATGCIMVILNILELYSIRKNFGKAWQNRSQDITKEVFGEDGGPMFDGAGGMRSWIPGADGIYEMSPRGYPDAVGIPMLYTTQRRHRGRKSGLPRNPMQEEVVYS